MKRFSLLLICITLLYCCKNASSKHVLTPDKRLLRFQSKMVYPMDSLQFLDDKIFQALMSADFNSKTDTIKYLKDKIYVSCIITVPGCARYAGNIQFQKDTLRLLFENLGDVVCSEEDGWRLIYEINNKENKKYIIKKY